MICSDCSVGADFNSQGKYEKSEELHGYCKGDCGCQHKTGPGWYAKRGSKVPPMQTQSP